ncbi:MAG: zinc-dependent peptidase [Bacteroidota bacterium]|nr:zinc-dependent peptidase [Bacteroidota bacterium]
MQSPNSLSLEPNQLSEFYEQNFSYFNKLNNHWQNIFIGRCIEFIALKQIISHNHKNVNNSIKAIIAASAVQLTLGIDTWQLSYFDTIIIHPEDFENTSNGLIYKGETSLNGIIKLSFKSFINGYKNSTDNINLGLHEFTHALRFNSVRGHEQDYFIDLYFSKWLVSASEAFNNIKNGKDDLFRKYGGTNINEFMSVCIEHYFESPHQIKERYIHLYYNTAILLNQETTEANVSVNVRQKFFEEKNMIYSPITNINFKYNYLQYGWLKASLIVFSIALFTTFKIGINQGPSLILFLIAILLYCRFDYSFTKLNFTNKEIEIKKGFSFFSFLNPKKILLSQLISVSSCNKENNIDLNLIYYQSSDTYFYEENFNFKPFNTKQLFDELRANKIAIFKM